jgi:hypothetical protein
VAPGVHWQQPDVRFISFLFFFDFYCLLVFAGGK